jgi:hypothetical protein
MARTEAKTRENIRFSNRKILAKFSTHFFSCLTSTPHASADRRHSRQIAEASPNTLWILHLWILHLALSLAIPLCALSVTKYRVYSANYDPR